MNARIQSAAAARVLGVSQRSVQGLALRGELPGAALIGRVWTFDAGRLAAFVTQRERDAERPLTPGAAPKQPRLPTRSQTDAAYDRLMKGRYSRTKLVPPSMTTPLDAALIDARGQLPRGSNARDRFRSS
jgi:hypothetical protein